MKTSTSDRAWLRIRRNALMAMASFACGLGGCDEASSAAAAEPSDTAVAPDVAQSVVPNIETAPSPDGPSTDTIIVAQNAAPRAVNGTPDRASTALEVDEAELLLGNKLRVSCMDPIADIGFVNLNPGQFIATANGSRRNNAETAEAMEWFSETIGSMPEVFEISSNGRDRCTPTDCAYRAEYLVSVDGAYYPVNLRFQRAVTIQLYETVTFTGCLGAPDAEVLDITHDADNPKEAEVIFQLRRGEAIGFPRTLWDGSIASPLDEVRQYYASFRRLDATGWRIEYWTVN